MPTPLNIIYLHSHDTGRYIAPYGYACRTPNMQRFAEQGVLFRQAFTVNPTCSPSRAALITGMYPHRNGMHGLAHRGFKLFDYHKTWLTTFRGLGYNTVITGQEHYGIQRPEVVEQGLGFETNLRRATNDGKDVTPAAIEFLEDYAGDQSDDRPFFLDIGFSETHRTGQTHSDGQWHNRDESPLGDPRYVRPPAPLPDTPATRADFADYETCVHRLDAYYGQILDVLDDTGLAANTIVVITTDHGLAFPGMKCSLTDHGLGVLLMMRGPASTGLVGGQVVDSMVTHMDIFPTLCDLLGAPTPDWVQGKSMVPLLDGTLDLELPGALHEAVFAQVNYHAAYEPKRCVRTPRYKYIKRFHPRPTQVLPNCDDSVSKTQWVEAGWPQREGAAEELYDLMFDPNEAANRVADPACQDVLRDMRNRLEAWQQANGDPILKSPLPMPEGGSVTPHSSYSPSENIVASDRFDPAHP